MRHIVLAACLIILVGLLIVFQSSKTVPIQPPKDCKSHDECASGVCSFYKKDNGKCARIPCVKGEKTDNNNFYCDETERWQKSKREGENCSNDFECFKQTCFMMPDCALTDIPRTKVSCMNNRCVSEILQDECNAQGMTRILKKEEFMTSDGQCMEKIVQRPLKTVCAPCGDKVCDEVESVCNCPEDCR